jgi:hypothetical protein
MATNIPALYRVCGVQVYEVYAHEVHARGARPRYTPEVHAREIRAHEIHSRGARLGGVRICGFWWSLARCLISR